MHSNPPEADTISLLIIHSAITGALKEKLPDLSRMIEGYT
jgi:hypothetical protein